MTEHVVHIRVGGLTYVCGLSIMNTVARFQPRRDDLVPTCLLCIVSFQQLPHGRFIVYEEA